MAIAAWCSVCGQHVWVSADGTCVNGHPADALSGHYDSDTGVPIATQGGGASSVAAGSPPATAQAADSAPNTAQPDTVTAQGTRLGLLADLLATFAQYPDYTAAYGTDTDVTIDNEIARASWGVGRKKVEYSAIMKAVESERTLYFWEILKEEGSGLSFGGSDFESTSTFGTKRWGVTKEKVIGPGGTVVDYTWDYAQTRRIVESVAARHGWRVKVVLRKKAAQY